ncbi:MAG TPA: ABC transporter ATP-binding protein [Planctomycetes bacterium]|nr:ABC transporter ATP-binding protein [Planctomycetota bacterium]
MIQARNLRKRFGDVLAVDDLSLDVEEGEVYGLLGPNGAGKTTTIHMLVGLLHPERGEVTLAGQGAPEEPETRRILGVAPQALSLYDELTGRENLKFIGSLYGLHGEALNRRVAWALDFAQLEEKARQPVATYSGGMKRRLNLVAALLHRPRVLFLDEPTVGVDAQSRHHLLEQVRALADEGCTVLLTTHAMEEAERICDRVAIMDHGRLLALDTVPNLIAAHGGAAKVTAELRSAVPAGCSLPGPIDGQTLSFTSRDPLQDLLALSRKGVDLGGFHVERPDLEAVFLELTGRRLRD